MLLLFVSAGAILTGRQIRPDNFVEKIITKFEGFQQGIKVKFSFDKKIAIYYSNFSNNLMLFDLLFLKVTVILVIQNDQFIARSTNFLVSFYEK